MTTKNKPLVGIIMGSDSDWPTLEAAAEICKEFSVPHEVHVVSAHRTPDDMARYAKNAYKKGLKVIIAGAGGAAHLPGMVASQTPLPVIGVPVKSDALSGMDSLLSIVQMPGGVPVATVAIGAGKNAGLLAVEILATSDTKLMNKLIDYKKSLAAESRQKDKSLNKKIN
jgi:5-(carboxyamino)imidazole ribonucleotide mutase